MKVIYLVCFRLGLHPAPATRIVARCFAARWDLRIWSAVRIVAAAIMAIGIVTTALAQCPASEGPNGDLTASPTKLIRKILVNTSKLGGTVIDPYGAVVVGAKVTLTNEQTKETQEVETNFMGVYDFWVSADYTNAVSIKGRPYLDSLTEHIRITPEVYNRNDVTLKIGLYTEQVMEIVDNQTIW